MADARIKSEPGVKLEPGVKPEPGASPMPDAMDEDEDDMYEDAGDLEFYDQEAANNAYGSVYLARIPKYVWEAWDKIDEEEEIQIGTMRYWVENGQPRMQLLLDSKRPEHQNLPREYSLDITTADVNNTYVFTEEDLPGYKGRSNTRAEAAAAGIPMALLNKNKPADGKAEKPVINQKKRWQPYYRKAIPKKTKVFGKVKYEIAGAPLENAETDRLLRARAESQMKPKAEVKRLVAGMETNSNLAAAVRAAKNTAAAKAAAKEKPKKGEVLKAARISKNQLLDMLFACYREFQYWPIRALRQRTQQPESYLRQTLEEIAVLNKSGRFANLWSLRPEYQMQDASGANKAQEVAPDEDDDDEEEMEDVI